MKIKLTTQTPQKVSPKHLPNLCKTVKKFHSFRWVCGQDSFNDVPVLISALLGLLVGIWGMIAGWIHLRRRTIFLEKEKKRVFFWSLFIFPQRVFVFDTSNKNVFYLDRNSWWLYVCILGDICALHRCAGCHKLHIEWREAESPFRLVSLKQA